MSDRTTWTIDPAHTGVEFSVKHMMFSRVRGSFRDVEGTVVADEDDPSSSSVEVTIDAASIDTGNDDRDEHLRSEDFLDVEEHPEITFRSTRVEGAHAREGDRFELTGELTIRGETREVTLDAVFEGQGEDPWGNQRAGFRAEGEIDRRDWGVEWNQALETGGVLVGHTVEIEIEAQAVKEAEEADEDERQAA